MWSFETVTQQRLGKKNKHKRTVHEELRPCSHMMQSVSAISRYREGKDQVQQTELELAGKKTSNTTYSIWRNNWNTTAKHNNVEIEHDTYPAISYPFKSKELTIWVWIWLQLQLTSQVRASASVLIIPTWVTSVTSEHQRTEALRLSVLMKWLNQLQKTSLI